MTPTKKLQLEQGLVIGLLLILGAVLAKGPLRSIVRPDGAAHAKPMEVLAQKYSLRAEVDPQVMPAPPIAEDVAEAPIAYTAQEMRDPFTSLLPASAPASRKHAPKPVVVEDVETPAPDLLIQGLMWGGTQPKAIIYGKVYGLGEEVQGVKIIAIDQRGVTIDHHGSSISYPVSAPTPAVSGGSSLVRPPVSQGRAWR